MWGAGSVSNTRNYQTLTELRNGLGVSPGLPVLAKDLVPDIIHSSETAEYAKPAFLPSKEMPLKQLL